MAIRVTKINMLLIGKIMKDKFYANRGIARNKRPFRNIVYKIELIKELKADKIVGEDLKQLVNSGEFLTIEKIDQIREPDLDKLERFEKYKFKDEGYLVLNWKYEGSDNNWS